MSSKIPIRFLDAGLGTTLESPPHNVKFKADSSLWSSDFLITSPDTLSGVHRAFVEAGADVLLTATYQASLEGFAATSKAATLKSASNKQREHKGSLAQDDSATYNKEEASVLMRKAVSLAKQAFSSKPYTESKSISKRVALSLGAYGATMQPSTEYSGDYKPEYMRTVEGLLHWHEVRLSIFRDDKATWNDVDFVSFETLPVLQEVQAVRRVMAQHNTNQHSREWWISCVFPNDDLTLPDGSPVSAVVEAMLTDRGDRGQRPWGIGINCTDIKKLDKLLRQYEAAAQSILDTDPTQDASAKRAQWPWLVTYPDGAQGSVYNTETQQWEIDPEKKAKGPQRPWHEELAEIITKTAERGHWKGILVGGCCKTKPDDIRKLRSQLAAIESDAYYLESG
ncbi:MAG: hypothetical protein L6R42_000218 [Xanthoria sp. 1 TBL-2021]|nr:MAG: hypothetical protein L6R42_000218 [Xanthoria sp. 1 TBL-2021]